MSTQATTVRSQDREGLSPRAGANLRHFNVASAVDVDEEIDLVDSIVELPDTSLPVLATGNDVREVVRFLKNKQFGVSVIEAMNAEPRRVFDARKIAAYEFWGIIERTGERLKLSELGQELAERISPECEIHRRILRSIPAYLGALESFYEKGLKIVTRIETANYWKDAHLELDISKQDEKNVEAIAVSFFSLCHAAELGTTTIGKRGQPARLRLNPEELRNFYGHRDTPETASLIPWPQARTNHYANKPHPGAMIGRIYLAVSDDSAASISLGHLQTAVELADFEEVIYQVDSGSDFLPQSELTAIQQCQAAVFLLDASDCIRSMNGEWELRAGRLAKISVAIALLNQRVALLWESRDGEPPESLRQTNLHLFDGESFDWASGAQLVRQIKSLKA